MNIIKYFAITRVTAATDLEPLTQLGPLKGEVILEKDIPEDFDMKQLWQIFMPKDKKKRIYISTVNQEKSNWIR